MTKSLRSTALLAKGYGDSELSREEQPTVRHPNLGIFCNVLDRVQRSDEALGKFPNEGIPDGWKILGTMQKFW